MATDWRLASMRLTDAATPIQQDGPQRRRKREVDDNEHLTQKGCTLVNTLTIVCALIPSALVFAWSGWGLDEASGFAFTLSGPDKWKVARPSFSAAPSLVVQGRYQGLLCCHRSRFSCSLLRASIGTRCA